MTWQLRDDLFLADSGGRVILLDLLSERYLALSERHGSALTNALSVGAKPADRSALDTLRRRRLVRRSSAPTVAPPGVERPTRELEPRGRARPSLMARTLVARRRAAFDLRCHSLIALRQDVQARSPVAPPPEAVGAGGAVAELAKASDALAAWLPVADKCLEISLAFVRSCHRLDCPARLVFGVIAAPFQAHCWVQDGAIVLNDRLERVAPFTPIMAW